MSKFDPTKPVRTRDGRLARIICTDLRSPKPIVAAILEHRREVGEFPFMYEADGRFYTIGQSENDLINSPERRVRWLNCYPNSGHDTRENADRSATPDRIACVRVEYEEGEGLD